MNDRFKFRLWSVFIPNIFQYPRDCDFQTLREAKKEIKKNLKRRYALYHRPTSLSRNTEF